MPDQSQRRRPRKPPIVLAVALVAVVSLVAVVAVIATRQSGRGGDIAVVPMPTGGPYPTPSIGVQFHGTWDELSDADRVRIVDRLAATGVDWVRIDVSWSMIQPSPGRYDRNWGVPLVDQVLNLAHARGLKVLAMFWLTPGWANGNRGKRSLPSNVDDYATAIRWASARWRTQVQAWEVWNEPNSSEFLSPPDPAGYAELLQAAYPAVKAGNPAAKVVFGGTQYVDTGWIAKAYDAGVHGSFDVMAVHPYQGTASLPPDTPPDGSYRRLTYTPDLVALLRREGDGGKPVWYTEFGWSAHANSPETPAWEQGVSEKQQAAYLAETLSLVRTRYPQVTNVFWYTSRDLVTGEIQRDHRGLFRRDFSPRPVVEVIRCYVRGCHHGSPTKEAAAP